MSVLFSKLLFVNSRSTSFVIPRLDLCTFHFPFPIWLPVYSANRACKGKINCGEQGNVASSFAGFFTYPHTSMGTVPGTHMLWLQYWALFALLESWVSYLNRCFIFLVIFFHRCATSVCFGFLPLHRFLVLFLAWLFSLC